MARIVARMYKFINGCRGQRPGCTFLSNTDLDYAAVVIAKCSQRVAFSKLSYELLHYLPITAIPIARLRRFVNDRELICVGGRLSNAQLSEGQKHPVLLAKRSHFSLLLIRRLA